MKKLALVTTVIVTGLVSPVLTPVAAAQTAVTQNAGTLAWAPCTENDPVLGPMLKGLDCGTLEVPLDYDDPSGQKIKLALTRAKHTVAEADYQGVVILNRGQWPGGIGRDLPTRYAKGTTGLASDVGSAYDWIGFDPRGVGASEPAVVCDPSYINPGQAQPDPVPTSSAAEQAWANRAKAYAESCGQEYGDVLKHLTTKDAARDLDRMRIALGQERITFFGTDWGTYLGSVYATLYPNRVKRLLLDSVANPTGVGFLNQFSKNFTSEQNADLFFAWVAKYDSVYHLGTTAAQVEAKYYEGQDKLRAAPVDGEIGPAEWADVFEPVVYRHWIWMNRAKILSDFVVDDDPTSLKANYSDPGFPHQNRHTMTNAVNCTDGPWPKGWTAYSMAYASQYALGAKFLTWTNAWYTAPCAFWPVPSKTPVQVGNSNVEVLIVQPQFDAAHGLIGAYQTRALFPNSRLILEKGGHSVGAALSANNNTCLNTHVSNFLRDGTRPAAGWGTDATCAAAPDPVPTA
ncbi:alpha/beta fold hydrolase [Streptomyces sp. NPDC006864]|uniref:alpha/beta fold hydrolase n=1 Tax=Streptomyces sp. NPDC006864 TaxID=3154780 RepID=UPI003454358C